MEPRCDLWGSDDGADGSETKALSIAARILKVVLRTSVHLEMKMKTGLKWISALAAAFLITSCDEDRAEATLETVAQKIQNGVDESGFPAVGSLYLRLVSEQYGYYYQSYCTATLIRQNYVLTAAHCTDKYPASDVYFLIGEHAELGLQPPSDATLYAVKRFVTHPDFVRYFEGYDIGLVELQNAVTDVTPMPLFDGDLSAYSGQSSKSVGYGRTNADDDSGQSRRRSTDLVIQSVLDSDYQVKGDNTGICFGDSGGPNLVRVGDEWQVAGVAATLWATKVQNQHNLTCLAPLNLTRVETFKSWLLKEMGEPYDCNEGYTTCHCPEACQSDGLCEPYRCNVDAYYCYELLSNMLQGRSDQYESHMAEVGSIPEVRALYSDWLRCVRAAAENGEALSACMAEFYFCYGDTAVMGHGDKSCLETAICLEDCIGTADEAACDVSCEEAADGDASKRAYGLLICTHDNACEGVSDDLDCLRANCAMYSDCFEDAPADGGIADGGPEDAGEEDAGGEDGGEMDGGEADGSADAGPEDGGEEDAGSGDAGDAAVSEDAGSGDAGDAAVSEDAAVPQSDADTKPAVQDAAVTADASGEEEDDDGEDGCSAVPGSHSGSWLALWVLPMMFARRKRRA